MRNNEIIGKLPPQAVDIEVIVLGSIMLEAEALNKIIDFMKPEMFYNDNHNRIFKAILSIKKQNNPVDIITVTQELKRTKEIDIVGGAYYVTTLTNGIGSSSNIEFHARVIYEKFLLRQIINKCAILTASAYDEGSDVINLIDTSISEFRKLDAMVSGESQSDTIDEIIEKTFNEMDRAQNNKGVLGHPIGIKSVDEFLCGLQRKTVYVIAARPGMGKSALVKTIFINLAKQKIGVKLFSLEVSSEKFMMNIMSDILETNNADIFKGNLTEMQKIKLRGLLEEIKSYMSIDDKAAITIQYFERAVKKAIENGAQVIMIDYLQLMTVLKTDVDPKNREQAVSFLTVNIKRIANENNIPIIELAQLNRDVEKRADKRPILADLRDSGSIEQDAEAVLFIHRPEYYGITEDKSGNDLRGLAEIIIAKNRNGKMGRAIVKFTPHLTKFEDYYSPEIIPITNGQTDVFTENQTENPTF